MEFVVTKHRQQTSIAVRLGLALRLGVATAIACVTAFGLTSLLPRTAEATLATHSQSYTHDGMDHSAYRVDAEVWGWNEDYTEMGVMAVEVQRTKLGRHMGEAFVVIFPVGSVVPLHNINALRITHAEMPDDPLPLSSAENQLWGVGHGFGKIWPKRPIKEHFRGAIKVETIAGFDQLASEPDDCRASVGFFMRRNGQVRYQRHQAIEVVANCDHLRHTNQRVVWAKSDLAAAMVRFDYSADPERERSMTYPFSVRWSDGHTVPIIVRSAWPKNHRHTKKAVKVLKHYGRVMVEHDSDVLGKGTVVYGKKYRHLAEFLRSKLQGDKAMAFKPPSLRDAHRRQATPKAPIVVHLGKAPMPDPATLVDTTRLPAHLEAATVHPAPNAGRPLPPSGSSYLKDFVIE